MSSNNSTPSFILYFNGSRLAVEREAEVKKIAVIDAIDSSSSFLIYADDTACEWSSNSDFSEGSQVEILLGFKDQLSKVLTGEVVGISLCLKKNQPRQIIIRGKNHMHRIERNKTITCFSQMTDKDIIEQIAGDAGLSSGEIENLTGEHKFTLLLNKTGYEYLLDLAERFDCFFWVREKKFYFKRLIRNSAEDLVLEYGKTLNELMLNTDTSRIVTGVDARGLNTSRHEAVSGSVMHGDIDSPGGALVEDSWGAHKEIYIDYYDMDQNCIDTLAQDRLSRNNREYITGTGCCEGNPGIMAGCILKVKGLGRKFSGKYFIIESRHNLIPAIGYETKFRFISSLASATSSGNDDNETSRIVGNQSGQQKNAAAPTGNEQQEPQKEPAIINLKWMKDGKEITKALVGDSVVLTSEVRNINNGLWIRGSLYEHDQDGNHDFIKHFSVQVKDGKIEIPWNVEYHEDKDDTNSQEEEEALGYTLPEYHFILDGNQPKKVESAQSPVIEVRGWMKAKLVDEGSGKVLKNTDYILHLPDGSTEEGTTDENGYIQKNEIKLGRYYISLKSAQKDQE